MFSSHKLHLRVESGCEYAFSRARPQLGALTWQVKPLWKLILSVPLGGSGAQRLLPDARCP